MTTDFRALCAELLDWAEVTAAHYIQLPAVMLRARAALADEPASVAGQPSNEDLPASFIDPEHCGLDREMLATFYSACRGEGGTADEIHLRGLRAVLACWGNLAPQPPTEGEVAELVEGLRFISDGMSAIGHDSDSWFVARAADLLQRLSPPQPVPVSERLPEPEDCDAEGGCWWLVTGCNAWSFGKYLASVVTHWLPAHALPISQQQENTDG